MAPIAIDITNKRFGKLVALQQDGRDKWGQVMWLCHCDCGKTVSITSGNLRRPHGNTSCGCAKAERFRERYTKHGKSSTKEYRKEQDFHKRFIKYGITSEQFEELKVKQNYRCAICSVVPTKGRTALRDGFHIDHDHVSGRVRGLLCNKCNTGIGMLQESETILLSAIEYLRRASLQ